MFNYQKPDLNWQVNHSQVLVSLEHAFILLEDLNSFKLTVNMLYMCDFV